jgi:SIR2-like domain
VTEAGSVTAYHDRNVYILGAGFSVDGRIPVVDGFMNKMRDSTAWLAQEGRHREVQAVANVLKFRLESAAAAYRVNLDVENVEQLFSLASASSGPYGKDVPLAIAATVHFANQTVQPKRCQIHVAYPSPPPINSPTAYLVENRQCSRYDFYLALMTGSFDPPLRDRVNTIITFNYDLLVEDSLRHLSLTYDYGLHSPTVEFDHTARCAKIPDPQALKLLKLHGSVNWATADEQHPRVTIFGDYQAVLDANRDPLLVPPTWRKQFTELSAVWDEAVASLQTATRIIIIGYSMPPIDQHFKYLLAAGLQENISLRTVHFINPRLDELKEGFYAIFRQQYLERNVVEFMPFTVARYFRDNNLTIKINRLVRPPFGVAMLDVEAGEQ